MYVFAGEGFFYEIRVIGDSAISSDMSAVEIPSFD
jgi:hypothetical protein